MPPHRAGSLDSLQSLQYPPVLGDGALPQLLRFSACHPKAASGPCFSQKSKPEAPLQLAGLAPALRLGPSWLFAFSVPGSREWSPGRRCPSFVAPESQRLSASVCPSGLPREGDRFPRRQRVSWGAALSWGAWGSAFLLRQKPPANSKVLLRCVTPSCLCFRGDFTCPGSDAAKGWGVVPACPAPLPLCLGTSSPHPATPRRNQ